jgi:polyvinyl alcohol dehydrogenase (cytochrome)
MSGTSGRRIATVCAIRNSTKGVHWNRLRTRGVLKDMSRRAIVIFCCALMPLYGGDWWMYLCNLAHTSAAEHETRIGGGNVAQLRPIWTAAMSGPVVSGVTVADGLVYFGDWSGSFHALDGRTGAESWVAFLGMAPAPADAGCMPSIGISSQAVVHGDTVYAGGGDSTVYALDKQTGEVQWQVQLADPASGSYLWSSLMLSQGALYIGIASLADCPLVRGGLARIPLDDPAHPQIRYFTPENTQGAGVWSTPAIDEANGLVYVTTGNGGSQDSDNGVWGSALLALDAATLEVQSWFFLPQTPEEDDNDWGTSPLLFESGGQRLVAANGKNGVMYVLTRPDLSLVWSYKLAMDCDSPTQGCGSVSTPAFDGNILVTGAGQGEGDGAPMGTVTAFDPSGNLLWQYAAPQAVLAPVTLTPGLVFAANSGGLAVLDAGTGAELWNDGGRGAIYGQPVVANGYLYATYVNGKVVAWTIPPQVLLERHRQ